MSVFYRKTRSAGIFISGASSYGKDPYVIRCNRGDTLHLTFSTDDTGHSFFLEEFDMDVKISPSSDEVTVFKTSDPTAKPVTDKGSYNHCQTYRDFIIILFQRVTIRCHVWCGPMHAFEQGKLIILPNTLLIFSLGSLAGNFIFMVVCNFQEKVIPDKQNTGEKTGYRDLLKNQDFLKGIVVSRYTQAALTIITMVMIYIVILTSVFGTKVSGRNLGVLLMWAIWLFALVAVITPFLEDSGALFVLSVFWRSDTEKIIF